jgi:glycerol kinase
MDVARELVLALDLGTTGVRAVVWTPEGAALGQAYRTLPVRFPAPGRVEQDPETLHRESLIVLHEALAGARAAPADVAALGIATQRATALVWDAASGKPLAPALGWQDRRRAAALDRLRDRGIAIPTQAALAKLLWWLESSAEVQAAARAGTLRFGTPDVWLGYRLSGGAAHVTDPGHAGCTALYHPQERDWAHGFLELLEIDVAWLPAIVASAGIVAQTAEPAGPGAALAGIPLAARAGDQQASAFAAGLRRPGQAKLTLGTAAMLDLHTGEVPAPAGPGVVPLPLWRLPDGSEHHCLEGHVATAGSALEWCVSLGFAPDVPALERLARSVRDDGGVVAVPAFQGLGTPFDDEAARGFVSGLTRGSSAAELARALFEGVAQRCVDVWEAMEPEDTVIRVDGGLSRSSLLLERLAMLSGRTVLRAPDPEGTARGVAALAQLACGSAPTLLGDPEAGERFEPLGTPAQRQSLRARWRRTVEQRVSSAEWTCGGRPERMRV